MIINSDALTGLAQVADASIQMVCTSPPYYRLRKYDTPCAWPAVSYSPMAGLPAVDVPAWYGELGAENDLWGYIGHLVAIMREVRRVLRADGTVWLNCGDSYAGGGQGVGGDNRQISVKACIGQNVAPSPIPAGLKAKDLMMIPARLALALQADGFWLRSQIIWHKPSTMPQSVTDRPTTDYEPVYLLAKSERYYYDKDAIAEPARDWGTRDTTKHKKNNGNSSWIFGPHRGLRDNNFAATGRNSRTTWSINTEGSEYSHYALMPSKLAERCILAGSSTQACPHCLAPWRRVVEREKHPTRDIEAQRTIAAAGPCRSDGAIPGPDGMVDTVRLLGWQPTCKCKDNDGTGKCIVLDPFGGGGTTALAAYKLGRDYCLIEPVASYIEDIAKERLTTTMPLLMGV